MFEAFVSRTRTTTKCFEICFPFFSISALSSPQELVLFLFFFYLLDPDPPCESGSSRSRIRNTA